MLIRSAKEDVKYVMHSREEIAARVRELGRELTEKFGDKKPLMLCVLRGAAFFFTDLCKEMDCLMDMDFISASSYFKGTKSTGTVHLVKDTDINMEGRHVIVVEDIIDSGLTLEYLVKLFLTRNPASVTTVSLLDKEVDKPERFLRGLLPQSALHRRPQGRVLPIGGFHASIKRPHQKRGQDSARQHRQGGRLSEPPGRLRLYGPAGG